MQQASEDVWIRNNATSIGGCVRYTANHHAIGKKSLSSKIVELLCCLIDSELDHNTVTLMLSVFYGIYKFVKEKEMLQVHLD